MMRKMLRAGVFGLLGMVGMMASYGIATSANAPDAEIGEVMKKSFGKGGYKGSITAAVKGEKWEDAAKLAKEWNDLAPAQQEQAAKGQSEVVGETLRWFREGHQGCPRGYGEERCQGRDQGHEYHQLRRLSQGPQGELTQPRHNPINRPTQVVGRFRFWLFT